MDPKTEALLRSDEMGGWMARAVIRETAQQSCVGLPPMSVQPIAVIAGDRPPTFVPPDVALDVLRLTPIAVYYLSPAVFDAPRVGLVVVGADWVRENIVRRYGSELLANLEMTIAQILETNHAEAEAAPEGTGRGGAGGSPAADPRG